MLQNPAYGSSFFHIDFLLIFILDIFIELGLFSKTSGWKGFDFIEVCAAEYV